jgi:nucleoid-associated protein YgaU
MHRISRPRTGTRGAFARIDDGETLADVARRVYGSAEKVDVLWKANRDQLSKPEAPLGAGMLLRTP